MCQTTVRPRNTEKKTNFSKYSNRKKLRNRKRSRKLQKEVKVRIEKSSLVIFIYWKAPNTVGPKGHKYINDNQKTLSKTNKKSKNKRLTIIVDLCTYFYLTKNLFRKFFLSMKNVWKIYIFKTKNPRIMELIRIS